MNYPTVVNDIDFRDLIFVANNDPVTDSFMVAKAFGKLPKNVVRDIERTIEACPPEFDTKLNFELCYKTMSYRMVSRKILPSPQGWVDAFGYVLHQKKQCVSKLLTSTHSTGCTPCFRLVIVNLKKRECRNAGVHEREGCCQHVRPPAQSLGKKLRSLSYWRELNVLNSTGKP